MFFITLVVFILVLGLLVLVHEFGHYITARMVGMKVEEFAIGMGPKIWGKSRKSRPPQEMIHYNLRLLPIGGYVKIFGQEDYDNQSPHSFSSKTPAQRLLVLVAGVAMNMLLAVLFLYIQGANNDFKYRNIEGLFEEEYRPWFGEKSQPKIAIGELTPSSPLQGKVNDLDIITKIDGNADYDASTFREYILERKGKEVTFEVVGYNSSEVRTVNVVPRVEIPEGEGSLGLTPLALSFTEYKGIGKVFAGFSQSLNTVQNFGYGIGQLVKMSQEQNSVVPLADNVGGAIGIFETLEKIITNFGFWGVLELATLFSINLALFNILPIPALDGGHIFFTLMEMVSRRKLNAKFYNYVSIGGFLLLMGFMLLVTSLDLVKHTGIRDAICPNGKTEGFLCQLTDYR